MGEDGLAAFFDVEMLRVWMKYEIYACVCVWYMT
jgi:hypothetical protein